jgi:hypothetical protein
MDNVIVVDSHCPSYSVRLYQFTVCAVNKAATIVFFIWIQRKLQGLPGYICVEIDEFAMSLASSDNDFAIILPEERLQF